MMILRFCLFLFGLLVACALTAITSALVLGLVSGAMLFGHWYLIDLEMPVDYLRTFVRLLGIVLVGAVLPDVGMTKSFAMQFLFKLRHVHAHTPRKRCFCLSVAA